MEFELPERPAPSINLTALIDIVFILVIFVIIAANFERQHSVQVDLPETEATADVPEKPIELVLTAAGQLQLDGKTVPLAELDEILRPYPKKRPVLIAPDKQLPVDTLLKVFTRTQKAGFKQVSVLSEDTPS